MKGYPADVINRIQQTLDYNTQGYDIKPFESLDEFPTTLYFNGVRLQLLKNDDNYSCICRPDEDIDNSLLQWWKQTPMGKYVSKDWKRNAKGVSILDKYVEMHASISNINMVILLRILDEDEMTESEYEEMTDINLDDTNYAIIKIYIDNYECYSCPSYFDDNIYEAMPDETEAPKKKRGSTEKTEIDDDDDMDVPEYFGGNPLF